MLMREELERFNLIKTFFELYYYIVLKSLFLLMILSRIPCLIVFMRLYVDKISIKI